MNPLECSRTNLCWPAWSEGSVYSGRVCSQRLCLFLKNKQLIDFGELAVRLPGGKALVFVIEFVAVDDAVFVGGNRHQCFPAIRQQRRALHGILIEADDDVGLDRILDKALLAAGPFDTERVLTVVFAREPAGSQVDDGGGSATDDQKGNQYERQKILQGQHNVGRGLHEARADVKLDLRTHGLIPK